MSAKTLREGVRLMAEALTNREWAEHACADPDAAALETQITQLVGEHTALREEVERLRTTIDSRPAINAGLPETYIEWSRSIYAMDFARALETKQ